MKLRTLLLATSAVMAGSGAAYAEVSVCISVSATGATSSLGVPQVQSVQFLPTEVAGQAINYIILDDATDPALATQNARKCVNEDAADVIIGGSGTPTANAVSAVAGEAGTVFLGLAPFAPTGDQADWSFVVPQPVSLMAEAIIDDIEARGITSLGFIGFNDGYGDLWLSVLQPLLDEAGVSLSPVERYARNDTSVSAQALRIAAENPEAVIVVASGGPAAGPNVALSERGYEGLVYHTHGSANAAFLEIAGHFADGSVMPVGPISVADQLGDDNPAKALGLEYTTAYEGQFGAGSVSTFGGYLYDAGLIVAASIPYALEQAEPGTPEFRAALRDAIRQSEGVPGVHGVYALAEGSNDLSDNEQSRVMAVVSDGALTILQ